MTTHFNGCENVSVVGDNKTLQFLFESGTNEGYLFSFTDYFLTSVDMCCERDVDVLTRFDGDVHLCNRAMQPMKVGFEIVVPMEKVIQEYSHDLIAYPLAELVNPGHRTILEQLKALNTQIDRREEDV